MILKIRKGDDPILREPVEVVSDFGHEFQFLIDNMIETMRKNQGVGLAAPQVGFQQSFFMCEFLGDEEMNLPPFPLTIICNPEIESLSENNKKMVEGCLSFPGLELLISRPEKVKIKGVDRYGKPIEIETDGLYSRVLQHENDHLKSTLFIDRTEEVKIIFIGTGTLGLKSLELLANDSQYKIEAVITGQFDVSGRIKKENAVLELANKLKLPLVKVSDIKDRSIIGKIKKLKPDVGVMADFGQIVPKEILDIPKNGIVNIHPSLLPKYRGPSPIQQTILDGEEKSGVTLILANEKMDAGSVISQATTELSEGETATTLKEHLGDLAATLLLNSLPYYLAGDLKPEAQNEKEVTVTKMIRKEDGEVNFETPAKTVERKIRAFNEWPKVYINLSGKRILLLASHFEKDDNFIVDRIKPEGKKEMTYEEYLRGYKNRLTFDA